MENGFRFLKDLMFSATSFYLKSPKRIMALLMVMTVCLLVYAALEYRIRQGLETQKKTFPNQKGKAVNNPTAKWVFQCFEGIHLLRIHDEKEEIILCLNEHHLMIVSLSGERYESFYS